MKTAKTIIIAILAIGIGYFVADYFNEKKEGQRKDDNIQNLLKEFQNLKSDMIQYEFDKEELEQYLKQSDSSKTHLLNGLYSKLEEQDIEIKNINRIVSTQIHAQDTTYNKIILDSISNILNALKTSKNKRINFPFEDKTECFEFKAQIVFENNTSYVEVLDRKYNDTIYHVDSWERKQWQFWFIKSRFLGKRIIKITIFNDCGFMKTIVIEKRKKDKKGS